MLGADCTIEERTRCLIGIYASLVETRRPPPAAVDAMLDVEFTSLFDSDAPSESSARENFHELLGLKLRLHTCIRQLLETAKQLSTAKGDDEYAALQKKKDDLLIFVARVLIFENDLALEEVHYTLEQIIFESKDRNILKYLHTLATPLTQYSVIRLTQSSLVQACRGLPSDKKRKASSPGNIATRLAAAMSMVILPMESIDMIFHEIAANMKSHRIPMVKNAQELLLLIAKVVPAYLTHPSTMRALYSHLEFKQPQITQTTLNVLTHVHKPATMHQDAPLAGSVVSL